MRTRFMTGLAALALACLLGTATAEYDPSRDVRIGVDTAATNHVARVLGLGRLGGAAFGVQEGAHRAVTHTTGISIDRYYVWVCLGSECVPVDPFTVGN